MVTKQFIGVKFMNNGPYSSGSTLQYDYYNNPSVTSPVEVGDIVVVETRYGPAVAEVTEIYSSMRTNATCRVYEVLDGPYGEKVKEERRAEREKAAIRREITEIKKQIKGIMGDVTRDPIALARLLAEDVTGLKKKQKKLTELFARLDVLEERTDDGLPF